MYVIENYEIALIRPTKQVRHVLTQELRDDSGNISYGVRPTERKKAMQLKCLN